MRCKVCKRHLEPAATVRLGPFSHRVTAWAPCTHQDTVKPKPRVEPKPKSKRRPRWMGLAAFLGRKA